jgi:hypothetical protein
MAIEFYFPFECIQESHMHLLEDIGWNIAHWEGIIKLLCTKDSVHQVGIDGIEVRARY